MELVNAELKVPVVGIEVSPQLPLVYVDTLVKAIRCARGNREMLEAIKREFIFGTMEINGLLDEMNTRECA